MIINTRTKLFCNILIVQLEKPWLTISLAFTVPPGPILPQGLIFMYRPKWRHFKHHDRKTLDDFKELSKHITSKQPILECYSASVVHPTPLNSVL